ncbi:hypothetical protein niasHT_010788 [Heterodera trifolii]|uniref:Uncharacterized protein n=1 Tax=Heterodera trifolii TaxID=157864 RepID=A0ABD2KVJ8_9BILA
MSLLSVVLLLFSVCSFVCFQFQSSFGSTTPFIFVTLSSDGREANINLLADQSDNGAAFPFDHPPLLSLPSMGQTFKMRLIFNVSAHFPPNGSAPSLASSADDFQNAHLSLYSAKVHLGLQQNANGQIEYALISGGGGRGETKKVLKWPKRGAKVSDERPLRVCVFGDYRADVMYTRELNLSNYVVSNDCHLNLFIGKIAWEQRNCPNCSTVLPDASPFLEDVGLSFSPFSMLNDHAMSGQTNVFASVPSIFGAIGHNLNETTFYDCTEFDGIAFIQTTVEVSTVARLGGRNQWTEQFENVERFFRETMLNELECKLQELHRRPQRPWVVVYLTHPSLVNERRTEVLSLKDNDRFFEILNRYKIDLLLSCGVEGMAKTLAERRLNKPNEHLPPYLNTTMATCLNAKNCQYLVLEVKSNELNYWYKSGEGIPNKNGKFQKATQSADECIANEIPLINGKNTLKIGK